MCGLTRGQQEEKEAEIRELEVALDNLQRFYDAVGGDMAAL
jgi:hypothetical protein